MQALNTESHIAQIITQAYALELHNVKFESDCDSLIAMQGDRLLGHIYKRGEYFYADGVKYQTLYHATAFFLGRSEVNRIYRIAQSKIKYKISF